MKKQDLTPSQANALVDALAMAIEILRVVGRTDDMHFVTDASLIDALNQASLGDSVSPHLEEVVSHLTLRVDQDAGEEGLPTHPGYDRPSRAQL